MGDRIRSWLSRLQRSQAGFTLVELLVVVGIIVALAAVIIPNVASFSGKGETGAQAAETENVQTAFDAMMADKGISGVTATATASPRINGFSALPTGTGSAFLYPVYLREATTKYWYCWTGTGILTQFTATGTCP